MRLIFATTVVHSWHYSDRHLDSEMKNDIYLIFHEDDFTYVPLEIFVYNSTANVWIWKHIRCSLMKKAF